MSIIETIRAALYGSPPSQAYQPSKDGVIDAFNQMVQSVTTLTGGVVGSTATIRSTKTLLDLVSAAADTLGLVYNDADVSKNGIYHRTGGAWVFTGLLGTGMEGPGPTNETITASTATAVASAEAALAASLTLPNVYATITSGLVAVSEGQTFWSNESGTTVLYRDIAGVATIVATLDQVGNVRNFANTAALAAYPFAHPKTATVGTTVYTTSAVSEAGNPFALASSSSPGSWWTQKPRDRVNVQDFGAIGNAIADDYASIMVAANYAISVNKPLYFPAGTYLCSEKITLQPPIGKRVSWVGDGYRNSILLWRDASATDGALITCVDIYRPPEVYGLGFQTEKQGIGTALKIVMPTVLTSPVLGPSVENCEFIGGDVTTDGWETALHFDNCWWIVGRRLSFKGVDGLTAFASKAAIKLTSCQVCWFSEFSSLHFETHVLETASGAISHGEGFSFQNFELVGGLDGISLAADGIAPGTNIGPGGINVNRRGVKLANQWNTIINGLLIYKTQLSNLDFIGVESIDCKRLRVIGNQVHGGGDQPTTSGSTIGMFFSGTGPTDECIVSNNSFQEFKAGYAAIGMYIDGGVGLGNFHDNTSDSTITQPILIGAGAEKTNRFHGNYPSNYNIFAANSATPSCGNAQSGLFYTANSSATTITNFVDYHNLQEITVLVNDANTTIQHNAGLLIKGAVNYAAANGTILKFIRDGAVWREVSRSA